MTVRELIDELQKIDESAIVYDADNEVLVEVVKEPSQAKYGERVRVHLRFDDGD